MSKAPVTQSAALRLNDQEIVSSNPTDGAFFIFNRVLELPGINRTFLGSRNESQAENLRESFLSHCGSNEL